MSCCHVIKHLPGQWFGFGWRLHVRGDRLRRWYRLRCCPTNVHRTRWSVGARCLSYGQGERRQPPLSTRAWFSWVAEGIRWFDSCFFWQSAGLPSDTHGAPPQRRPHCAGDQGRRARHGGASRRVYPYASKYSTCAVFFSLHASLFFRNIYILLYILELFLSFTKRFK